METFNELRLINVNEHTEQQGQLTYLSWTYCVDILWQNDNSATWEFLPPIEYNETMMVRTQVTAFGKTLGMQLPVMDNRNNAITNPDARKISDSQMRCLAKNIACFGIGLYIFAGSDLPEEDTPNLMDESLEWAETIKACETMDELKAQYSYAYKHLSKDKKALNVILKAKDDRKIALEQL